MLEVLAISFVGSRLDQFCVSENQPKSQQHLLKIFPFLSFNIRRKPDKVKTQCTT